MSCIRGNFSYRAESHGDLLYPVTVNIQNAYGGFTPVTMYADTGNEKTLAKRNVAELLGIPLERGEPFRVKGINGNGIEFRKFKLMVKIGSLDAIPISIGFCMDSNGLAENLLGNEDVLKSGKLEAIYDGTGVTYRDKGHSPRVACGDAGESQQTMNNMYDHLTNRRNLRKSYADATNSIAAYGYEAYF